MTKLTWNGGRDDPDQIVHFGVTLPKGVPVDVPKDNRKHRLAVCKAIGNPHIDVEGYEDEYEDGDPGQDVKVQRAAEKLREREAQKATDDAKRKDREAAGKTPVTQPAGKR